MLATLRDVLSVASISMFKFTFGPFLGGKLGLSFLGTYVSCLAGMNLSVLLFSFFGKSIKQLVTSTFYRKSKRFTKGNRRIVYIWQKYGLLGIAILTPPLLTPPVGTLVASSFGEPRQRIVLYMLISSLVWGLLICYAAYELKEVPFLKRILG